MGRRSLLLVAALAVAAFVPQTASVPVTFAWDLDPSHEGATFELEATRAGTTTVLACGAVVVTATDRRCTANLELGSYTFRLRGTGQGESGPLIGEWSAAFPDTLSGPGPFTIRAHWAPFSSPEPTPMAVSYIGSTSTSGNSPDAGDWTLPVGWAAGDVAVFWWYAVRSAATFDDPAGVGVTQKHNIAGGASTNGTLFIGYRVLQAGDSTFAWTGSTGASVDALWGVDVFRGVHTTGDPFEAQSGTPADFTDINDPDPPAVTPVSNDAAIWTIFGKSNDFTSITQPTDYTLAANESSTAGADGSVGTAYRLLTGGAGVSQDPGVWTLGGGTAGDDGIFWTAALKPAAGGGGRTALNTRAFPLGMAIGMHWRCPGACS